MLRGLRNLILVIVFAALGAVAGRVAAEARSRQRAGQQPADIDLAAITLRPRDVVPGIAVAMRVGRRPWSFLHVPPWIAAFATNFGVAMYGSEIEAFTGARDGDPVAEQWGDATPAPDFAGEPAPESAPSAGEASEGPSSAEQFAPSSN